MKALAAENPSLVRLFMLPNRTYEGREVLGIEIAEDVANTRRPPGVPEHGRPPRARVARGRADHGVGLRADQRLQGRRRAGDEHRPPAAAASSCRSSTPTASTPRAAPRSATTAATRPSPTRSTSPPHRASTGARTAASASTTTALLPGLGRPGRERRRPEPQLRPVLGRAGLGHEPAHADLPRPGAVLRARVAQRPWLVSHDQVTTLITNHTTAGLVLRAPGLAAVGDPVDEHRGYKALGDAMARQNGYFSQKGFELYDTTGTTEDWSYNATGGFGFTFEIYCGAPNYATGDCDAPPSTRATRRWPSEWDGSSRPSASTSAAGATARRTTSPPSRTIDETRHSIIEGSAPAGTTLRLTKDFKTAAFDPAITVDDQLESTSSSARPGRSAGTSTPRRGRSWRRTAGARATRSRAGPRRPP